MGRQLFRFTITAGIVCALFGGARNLHAAENKILTPQKDEQFTVSSDMPITWTVSSEIKGLVNFALYDATSTEPVHQKYTIVVGIPAEAESYVWDVYSNIVLGTYWIRMFSFENPLSVWSDSIIIGDKVIRVHSPKGLEQFVQGDTLPIRWYSEHVAREIYIDLLHNGAVVRALGLRVNTGYFDWVIPKDLPSGRYAIRVRDGWLDHIYGVSKGEFSIGTLANDVSPSSPPRAPTPWREGDLVRAEGTNEVWLLKHSAGQWVRRRVFGPQLFRAYPHLKEWQHLVRVVPCAVLEELPIRNLVRAAGSEEVYVIVDFVPGVRASAHHLATPVEFRAAGYVWSDVFTIHREEMKWYIRKK